MAARNAQREAEQQHEYKAFQQQCQNETAHLLKQVTDIQTMISNNEKLHLERNQRFEAMFKARDEKMEAIAAAATAKADAVAANTNIKFDQIMASILAAQSAKVPPPEDADNEQTRGRAQKAASAHNVTRTRSNSPEENAEASGRGGKKKC